MNNNTLFGIGGIIVGLILASVFGLGSGNGRMMNNTQMMSILDKHFIEQMIPHHDGAVTMANLALEKSKRPEIKTLASAIIVGQTKEIEDIIGWYKNWFGKDVPKGNLGMMGGGMMSGSGMQAYSSQYHLVTTFLSFHPTLLTSSEVSL